VENIVGDLPFSVLFAGYLIVALLLPEVLRLITAPLLGGYMARVYGEDGEAPGDGCSCPWSG
jgi:hypothetical protein